MQQCNPVSCASVVSPGEVKRFLFCQNYDTCLDYAIKSCWASFSCEECHCYERVEWDEEQWAEDYSRCRALAYSVAFAKVTNRLQNRDAEGISQPLKVPVTGLEQSPSPELA